jgi:cellulose synthase/poly-beta-1,6-N-acetylglucosamine synthase-like glycosyltransferase
MAEAVFWAAIAVVVYVYVGYPCVIFVLARLRPRPVRKAARHEPTVSFIIAAYNEGPVIAGKLANTLALDYPPERLEIIVASDGSTDATEDVVRREFGGRVKLLAMSGRHGKTIAQNRAVEAAKGEIVVFSDATTVYRPDSLRALVANFADPDVGCATGTVAYGTESEAAVDQGRAAYWNYESFLRRHESLFWSVLGASGCVYSLRRRLYTPLEADVISDVAQAIRTVEQGYRAVVEDAAVVFEPTESRSIREELQRRARVITRGLRVKFRLRRFFLRHPWFLVQVLSHRILRWAVPFFLIVALAANALLLDRPVYRILFLAQLALYGVATLAYVLERKNLRPRALVIPLYFCIVNLAPLLAVRALLRGEKQVTWETGRTGG